MMANAFKATLGLPDDYEDDEIASALVARLTAAIDDEDPTSDLCNVSGLISTQGGSQYLDPLNMLPILLPVKEPGAMELISTIGECCSAREVIIAVQEAAERLERSFIVDLEEPEADEDGDQSSRSKRHSRNEQVVILIGLYTQAIPRLTLRRKSALQTIQPLVEELTAIVKLAGPTMNRDESRGIVSNSARFSQRVYDWVRFKDDSLQQRSDTKIVIKDLLDGVVSSCVPNVQCSIAQRTFEKCLPKFVVRSAVGDEWKEGERSITDLLGAYHTIEVDLHSCTPPITMTHLIASAYQLAGDTSPSSRLTFLLPALISSLQSNTFLDESLAVLIRLFHGWPVNQVLSPEVTVQLANTLPTIASVHADPLVRHQAYRALSLLLASSEPKLHFQQLAELTGQSDFPQMRVAAVGLVKEHFLHAFNAKRKNDPFLSNLFLRIFGPILFRSDPPDLFEADLEIKEFEGSSEPTRLSECLSLYLLILRRDEKNLTGIRDHDMIKTIEANLLAPIRKTLNRWIQAPIVEKGHISLLLWPALERVEDAIKELHL